MKKKSVVITFVIVVFVVIGLCLEYSSKHEFAPEDAVVSGTLVKKFKDRKKETKVPAAVFPYDDKNLVIMNIVSIPPSKTFITKDFMDYEELPTIGDGQAIYQLADSFDDYIIWTEVVYGGARVHNYFLYSEKKEELKCIYSLKEGEFVDDRKAFFGGYNNHLYSIRKSSLGDKVEVISYDIESGGESTINSFYYNDQVNYSLKVNDNLLILLALDENNEEVVRVIDLDTFSIKDTKIPDEIDNPIYVDYDQNRDLFAFITNPKSTNSVYTYAPSTHKVKCLCKYENHFEVSKFKLDVRNGYVMWRQEKNSDGGTLSYYGIMMYNIETGKLEKIEKAFNYNFINDNEFYYFTYPKNTDSYRVNMYKYNMEKD